MKILLSFLVQVHLLDLPALHMGELQNFIDKLVDHSARVLLDHLGDNALADLKTAMCGKLAIRRSELMVRQRQHSCHFCLPPRAESDGRLGERSSKLEGLRLSKVIEQRGKELGVKFLSLAAGVYLCLGFATVAPQDVDTAGFAPILTFGSGAAAATVVTATSGALLFSRSYACDEELRARLQSKLGADAASGARLVRWSNKSDLTELRDQTEAELDSVKHGLFRADDGREVVAGWPRVFCGYSRCPDCGAWAYETRDAYAVRGRITLNVSADGGSKTKYATEECLNCGYTPRGKEHRRRRRGDKVVDNVIDSVADTVFGPKQPSLAPF